MIWTDARIARLRELLLEFSFTQTGLRMGVSRNAINGAVRRYIHNIPDVRDRSKRNRKKKGTVVSIRWDEERLTEPYAMRKLRKQMQ